MYFFSQNYDERGQKIFKLSFQLKKAKKYANFRSFFMLLLKEMDETYIILLICLEKGHSNNFKIHFRGILIPKLKKLQLNFEPQCNVNAFTF